MDTLDVTSFRDLAVEEFNTATLPAHARQQAEQHHYEGPTGSRRAGVQRTAAE